MSVVFQKLGQGAFSLCGTRGLDGQASDPHPEAEWAEEKGRGR